MRASLRSNGSLKFRIASVCCTSLIATSATFAQQSSPDPSQKASGNAASPALELEEVVVTVTGVRGAPRSVLEKTGLDPDYGIELGLLIDVVDRFGIEAVAQVDLGVRIHRNRPLDELRVEATDVLRAALGRALPPGSLAPHG